MPGEIISPTPGGSMRKKRPQPVRLLRPGFDLHFTGTETQFPPTE
jgi:hypothetical protein